MRTLAALGLPALALTGALAWLLELPTARRGSLEPLEAVVESPELDAALPSELASPARRPELAPEPWAPASTREAATPGPALPAPIHWVEGLVRFPAGTPADEHTYVLALTAAKREPREHKVAVAADGTFRMALPMDVRDAQLALEARYLFLEHPVNWQRGSAETVVLQPKLGHWIEGIVVDDRGARLEHFTLTAHGVRTAPYVSYAPSRSFEAAGGAFWMGGLAPGGWDLLVRSPGHLTSTTRIELPAAEPIQLVLTRSAVARGVALSPYGEPVPRAHIEVRSNDATPSGQANLQGRFEIEGLGPGPVTLRALSHRFAPSAPVTLELQAGERVEDLCLELREGGWAHFRIFQRREPVDAFVTVTDTSGAEHQVFATGTGGYRLGPAAAGAYTVGARRDGQTVEREFEVVPGAPALVLDLQL
jgi:hypothetical protein